MPSAALIVVNYKTALLAIEAIRTARATSSGPLQVIVVDNSTDAAEAEMLRPHAGILIAAERNLGYAAAINRARPHAAADILIIANPDVVFDAGCIDRLIAADAAVAGPALFWDDRFEWLLPPSELHTAPQVLDRGIASRSRAWASRRDRRRIRSRVTFWSLDHPARVDALSGAVMAIRSSAFDGAGGFDERFPLYFEENDFLRRVHGSVMYLPSARCRHLYNQSAAGSTAASEFYAVSERMYLRKWNGGVSARLLKALERPRVAADAIAIGEASIEAPRGSLIEASPLPQFETAAGHFARSTTVAVPASIWSAYRAEALYLRVVEPLSGAVLATYAATRHHSTRIGI